MLSMMEGIGLTHGGTRVTTVCLEGGIDLEKNGDKSMFPKQMAGWRDGGVEGHTASSRMVLIAFQSTSV